MNGVKFVDHSAEVKAQLERNKKATLLAMGTKAAKLIQENMRTGYKDAHFNRDLRGRVVPGMHTDIRHSGNLIGDVNYEVERSAPDTVDIGNSLEYAHFVHDGTYFMPARPYIRDAIDKGKPVIQETVEEIMKKGF